MTASLRCIWILVCAFALGLALACGRDSQEAEPAPETPAQSASPPTEPPSPEPVWSGRLPADFPSDVPQYPGASITAARTTPDQGMAVSFTTEDGLDTVASFYADGLAAEGWSTDIRKTAEGRAIFADKEKRSASAVLRSSEGGTIIDVIIVQMN